MSEEKKENTIIELEPDQAALIISEDGAVSLFMPDYMNDGSMDNEEVPPHVHYLTGIAALTVKGPELYEYVIEKTHELLDEEGLFEDIDEKE